MGRRTGNASVPHSTQAYSYRWGSRKTPTQTSLHTREDGKTASSQVPEGVRRGSAWQPWAPDFKNFLDSNIQAQASKRRSIAEKEIFRLEMLCWTRRCCILTKKCTVLEQLTWKHMIVSLLATKNSTAENRTFGAIATVRIVTQNFKLVAISVAIANLRWACVFGPPRTAQLVQRTFTKLGNQVLDHIRF